MSLFGLPAEQSEAANLESGLTEAFAAASAAMAMDKARAADAPLLRDEMMKLSAVNQLRRNHPVKAEATLAASEHKTVVVTYAEDTRPCGAKRYIVNGDGSAEKQVFGTSQGKMIVCEVSLDGPASIITPNVYAICSVPKGKPVDAKGLFDYGVLGSGAALTRSSDHFEFRSGVSGMMVCDLDPKGAHECFPALEYKDPAAYHATLASVCPALGNADAVSHPSGSHGDLAEIATGKVIKRAFGTHCRIAVKDQGDIPRALKALHERAMLAGHLHAFVDNAGIVHPRSIVDSQLGVVARPVFSCPAVVPQGYELRNRPALDHHYGDYLDTKAALSDLTAEERKKLDTKIEELKETPAVKALSEKRRAEFLARHPGWSRSVNSVGRSKDGYPTFLLTGGENIEVAGVGQMTARELVSRYEELANGGKLKLHCRDPLDPNYGTDSIAIVYDGIIFSWAHHGRVFRLPGEEPAHTAEDFNPITDARLWSKMVIALLGSDEGAVYGAAAAALSYRYALVRIGPAVHVLDRKHLHEFPGSAGLLKKEAFFDLYAALKFELPGEKPVNMARWWYSSGYRHTYDGIVLAPDGKRSKGQPAPANTFNLWRGFSCEPSEQGSCEKFKSYLLHIVCNGDQQGYNWLWRWMAQLVQHPWDKSGVVVALAGPQGAGKSTLGEVVGSLFHEAHYAQSDDIEELIGQFNSRTAGKLVTLLDEAFWTGDKRIIGKVKNRITSKTERLESKGVDGVTVDSFARYILTSNDDHVVNAEISDRRNTVFKVSNAVANDRAYFAALHAEHDSGGRARLLWELRHFDMGDGFIRPYENAALAEQKEASMEPVTEWFLGLLKSGGLLWDGDGNPTRMETAVLHEAACRTSRTIEQHVSADAFGRKLRKVATPARGQMTTLDGRRVWALMFPSLSEARAEFCRKTGLAFDWNAGRVTGHMPGWLRGLK